MQKCDRCGEQKEKPELVYHSGYSGDKELDRIFYFCKSCTEDGVKSGRKISDENQRKVFKPC